MNRTAIAIITFAILFPRVSAAQPELMDDHVDRKSTGTEPRQTGEDATAAKRPNVVVFLVDDLGWADLGCYWHFPHYSNHGMQSPGGAVRSGKFKLLEYFENGTVQLFDLEADQGEQHNLAETQPEIARRLLKKLRQWRTDVGAEMMKPNPGFDPDAADAVEIK